jgi:gamma-glutamyltranspeptidase / glutathione hydrolase
MKRFLRGLVPALLVVLLVVPAAAQSGRIPVAAEHGLVVTSQYTASEVGTEILRQGGNAVDAAVATAFALAVTYPSAGNIGGGGFMVYHGEDGEVTSFNFREKAPLAASSDMFLGPDGEILNNSNHAGPLAVGVPGTVAGLWLAHQRLGSLPWAELVAPAERLAREGIPMTRYMEGFMNRLSRREEDMFAASKRVFLKNGKTPYAPGDNWKQPDLAATLARIRDHGKDGFYRGKTAELLADYMASNGGIITEEDLAVYEASEQAPAHGTYRGHDVYAMSPPSSGGVAIVEMLNILEGFELAEIGHNSALYLHLLTESMRRAYADRAEFIGDPVFNPDMPLDRLTSKAYAKELRGGIDLFKASESDSSTFNSSLLPYESEETTHFSVVDAEGNMVSITYTLEFSYGSSLVANGTGFLLNNEMGDFNPVPGRTTRTGLVGTKPNLVEPEKRMLSSMAPAIVAKDGKPVLAIGSPGGRTIINTVLQVILNYIDFDMNVGQAVEAARIHHQWLPDVTSFETLGMSPDTIRLYEMMGHTVRFRGGQGHAHGVSIDYATGLRYGAADSRAYDGRAVGY